MTQLAAQATKMTVTAALLEEVYLFILFILTCLINAPCKRLRAEFPCLQSKQEELGRLQVFMLPKPENKTCYWNVSDLIGINTKKFTVKVLNSAHFHV